MRRLVGILVACAVIVTIFAGCDVLQKLGFGDEKLQPASSVAMGEDEAKKLDGKMPIHLYFANHDSTKLKLEVRYVPIADAKKSVNSLAAMIVKELIKGPTEGSGLNRTLPEQTKLLGSISIKSGVATVDLNGAFKENLKATRQSEMLAIYSIVNSLTELKDIQKVQFRIDGKATKELKGYFVFDAPFPRTTSIIDKESITTTETNQQSTAKPTQTPAATPKASNETVKPSTTVNSQNQSSGDNAGDVEYLE